MIPSFELSIEVSEQYDFNKTSLKEIEQNRWVKAQWPIVYFIRNESIKIAYVGESSNVLNRIKQHMSDPNKSKLNKISIIGSDKFNKSATLDIESNLIQYLFAEGNYKPQNKNLGQVNHNYYQKPLYKNLFTEIWNKLQEKKIVTRSLAQIENSQLFKYSPYKTLNPDQYKSVLEILDALTNKESNKIFVSGSAGTGKTVLANYLVKLLTTQISDTDLLDYNEDELIEANYIKKFQAKYPNAEIGFVVAMTSLRNTLKKVFKATPGLKPSMVIGPSDTFKKKYDLLIIDESHRLRQYQNISFRGVFKKNNIKLGLDDKGTELDWVIKNSANQIFFYDSAQSVKPSDVDEERFSTLLNSDDTTRLQLKSQMRVLGGDDYIDFVDEILKSNRNKKGVFYAEKYELIIFDSLVDLYRELEIREKQHEGLCRLVAGNSWEWLSSKDGSKNAIDIEIDGLEFQWNTTGEDWINSTNAFSEIGCIHTTQGYDLNYTGIIFGKEIDYNTETNQIEINEKLYLDSYGKIGASPDELKEYIINIYKTIMYRGIRGTFVYAVNENMREYLKKYIETYKASLPFTVLRNEDVIPYVNSVPLIDISVAAGNFSELQTHEETVWIELPPHITAKKGYFVCKVVGESMNKIIPNGSYCLFKQDEGGSRNGKIVLVESTLIQDAEFGSGYTVKEYHSEKTVEDGQWRHQSITLKPLSTSTDYRSIELTEDGSNSLRVVGWFECVII